MYKFDLEQLQEELNVATSLIEDITKEAKENGYYIDENNQIKKIDMVWVIDINYKYLYEYLGDSDWIVKYGKGTIPIKEENVENIAEVIKSEEDEYIDLDLIVEFIGETFGWWHHYLEEIPIESAKIEKGTFENGDLKITFKVRTERDERSFEICSLCIYKKPLHEVDIEHWEETGCC